VRELVLALIRNEKAFSWVDVEEAKVCLKACSMDLLYTTLESFHREEALVWFALSSMGLHLLDDVIQLHRIF